MKILFYTGKGGVGKSTMAASAAWQLAKKSRVLIVSLDPAHNLGDIFCVRINGKEKRMSDNLLLREVDLQKLSRDYLEREIGVLTRTYSYLQVLNLDRYFSVLKYSPGIEEYALLTSIEETIRKDGSNFDTVFSVFDRAFGTYYVPGPCDVPLGVDEDMGKGALGQYLHPFKAWSAALLGRARRPPLPAESSKLSAFRSSRR